MHDERIIKLLEEIKEIQTKQLELSQKSFDRYEQTVQNHNKDVSRGKKRRSVFS
jgi:hypothetical protein